MSKKLSNVLGKLGQHPASYTATINMEMALKLVMPWLSALDLGELARTCKAMAKAVRGITQRRITDATQGWETIAVPIENHVDDCLYPDFQYTPFSRLSAPPGLPFGGPWGGGEEVVETRRRGVTESEFGGAMVTGSVLVGPTIGHRCANDSTLRVGDRSHESFTENGGRSSISLARRFSQSDPLEPLEEGLEKETKKRRYEDLAGDSTFCRWTLSDGKDEQESRKEVLDRCRTGPVKVSSSPCGRFLGGALAYDEHSRLQIPLLNQQKILKTATKGGKQGRHGDRIPQDSLFTEVVHQDLDDSKQNSGSMDDPPLVMECGQSCSCSSRCNYRVSQNGLAVRAKAVRTSFKGWSLCAKQDIAQGSFVCEYAGELITTSKARERQKLYDRDDHGKHWQGSALLILREHLPSGQASVRVNVDATMVGNVARFINHSCDGGNLLPCLIRTAGCIIPKLALFARRAISDGEELTYSYGIADAHAASWKPCFCGTSACIGRLPSECT